MKHVVVKLLLVVRHVEHREGEQKHTLVSALEVLQELFGLRAVGGKVGRNDIHIVSGAHSLFLFLNGHFLEVGNLSLDGLDCLDLIHGLNVHIDNEARFHIQEVCQHTVVQLRCENLQEGHTAQLAAETEGAAVLELKGAGRDEVLDGQPGGSQPIP